MTSVDSAMTAALQGANHRVVQVTHPWLTVLAENNDGHAALVVQASLPADVIVGDGRGFAVKTVRAGADDFVRISSKDPGLPSIFLKFLEYVLTRSAEADSADSALVAFVNAVDQFRRFGARAAGRLSEEQIRGLFAELELAIVLERDAGLGAFQIFEAWGGPFGGLHDFEFANGYSIEVKSSHQPPKEIRITSPAQINPIDAGLDVVVLPMDRVSASDPAGTSFLDLVDEVRQLAERGGATALEKWDLALTALDLDVADEYYRQWRFLPGTWLRFEVTEGFPVIVSEAIPEGVVKVAFSLRVAALNPFAVTMNGLGSAARGD